MSRQRLNKQLALAASHQRIAARRAIDDRNWNRLFAGLLMAVLVGAMLLVVVYGTSSYTKVENLRTSSFAQREALDVIVNSIRASDSTDSIKVGKSSDIEGDALVLVQNLDNVSYETRIYLYEGNLVEEFALSKDPYDPKRATRLASTKTFEFSWNSERSANEDLLLDISVDQGSAKVALRFDQGGAA